MTFAHLTNLILRSNQQLARRNGHSWASQTSNRLTLIVTTLLAISPSFYECSDYFLRNSHTKTPNGPISESHRSKRGGRPLPIFPLWRNIRERPELSCPRVSQTGVFSQFQLFFRLFTFSTLSSFIKQEVCLHRKGITQRIWPTGRTTCLYFFTTLIALCFTRRRLSLVKYVYSTMTMIACVCMELCLVWQIHRKNNNNDKQQPKLGCWNEKNETLPEKFRVLRFVRFYSFGE